MSRWKALLFNYWMSDRRPVQHALATTLARSALDLSPQLQYAYISTFVRGNMFEKSGGIAAMCNVLLSFWHLFKNGKKSTIFVLTNTTCV